jgi:hypothetical protein
MSATVLVSLTLEVLVGESWGDDCTIGQIRKQAGDAAEARIRRLLDSDKSVRVRNDRILTVIVKDETA